ncbi:MAG: DUF1566 domain-containing protein, partial [Nanoarchaeota archaeon]|nr:DUF1566 domain-containing protein [Nanoarchaeota archaeon]
GCDEGYECSVDGVCTNPFWISGSCSGIEVYHINIVDQKPWGPTATDCRSPQCAIGLDSDYPLKYALVADNTVSFSSYPARDACKDLGGRLPTINELACISDNSGDYGTFVNSYYWSSTEDDAYNSRILWVPYGTVGRNGKLGSKYVRCVRSE